MGLFELRIRVWYLFYGNFFLFMEMRIARNLLLTPFAFCFDFFLMDHLGTDSSFINSSRSSNHFTKSCLGFHILVILLILEIFILGIQWISRSSFSSSIDRIKHLLLYIDWVLMIDILKWDLLRNMSKLSISTEKRFSSVILNLSLIEERWLLVRQEVRVLDTLVISELENFESFFI